MIHLDFYSNFHARLEHLGAVSSLLLQRQHRFIREKTELIGETKIMRL